jgi:hypothetical protein
VLQQTRHDYRHAKIAPRRRAGAINLQPTATHHAAQRGARKSEFRLDCSFHSRHAWVDGQTRQDETSFYAVTSDRIG